MDWQEAEKQATQKPGDLCPRCIEWAPSAATHHHDDSGDSENPHVVQELRDPMAMNALSRYGCGYICKLCEKAENAMSMGSFDMVRLAVQNDYDEALRLPAGTYWGWTLQPTGVRLDGSPSPFLDRIEPKEKT